MGTNRKGRTWQVRLADPFALLGGIGFMAQLVDHIISGAPGDSTLVYGCVVLMLGAPVQRAAEVLLGRGVGPPGGGGGSSS